MRWGTQTQFLRAGLLRLGPIKYIINNKQTQLKQQKVQWLFRLTSRRPAHRRCRNNVAQPCSGFSAWVWRNITDLEDEKAINREEEEAVTYIEIHCNTHCSLSPLIIISQRYKPKFQRKLWLTSGLLTLDKLYASWGHIVRSNVAHTFKHDAW